MLSLLLSLGLLVSQLPVPRIQVIDLDSGTPHHLVVIIDGEPYKVTSVPIGGPGPDPNPGPNPPPVPPDPDPKPVTGSLWVTYIMAEQPTAADAAPVANAEILTLVDGTRVCWRVQAATDLEISRRRLTEIVAAGVPVTVFQDAHGKVLKALKGSDPTAITATIKAYTANKAP